MLDHAVNEGHKYLSSYSGTTPYQQPLELRARIYLNSLEAGFWKLIFDLVLGMVNQLARSTPMEQHWDL